MKFHASDEIKLQLVPDGRAVNAIRKKNRIRYPEILLPTDIIDVGGLTTSGCRVQVVGDADVVTSGTVIRWLVAGDIDSHWGILTVAHGFRSKPALNSADAKIVTKNGDQIVGTRVLNLNPPELGIDATLIQVPREFLVDHGLIANQPAVRKVIPWNDLVANQHPSGISRQINRLVGFSVAGVATELTFAGVGTVYDLIHVLGSGGGGHSYQERRARFMKSAIRFQAC